MYKLTLIAFCLMICQIASAQNEKMVIEGAIILSDNDDPNPAPGTIRWTGQDFEGFDGTQWKSLTCGCDVDCSDDRYVTHTTTATSQSIQFEVENSQNLPMRLCYYPSSDPSAIQYWQCEPSTNYGAFGNEHLQTITGLNPAMEYTIIIQSSDDSSNSYGDCDLLVWEDISCPITVSTLSANNAVYCLNDPASSQLTGTYQIAHDSNTSWGVHGGTPPPGCPNDSWLKVNVVNGSFWGMGIRNALPPIDDEGWIAYSIKLINWNNSQHSMKLPGPSAYETNGHQSTPSGATNTQSYVSNIGGNGGGGSERAPQGPGATIQNGQIVGGAGKSWSARMTIGGVNTQYTSTAEPRYELYHSESTNVHSDGRIFGQAENWRAQTGQINEAQILDENWHEIKHYIKLNSIGNNDGILRGYLDGVLRYERTDIHFTDNPQFRNIALFGNVYHGGSIPATDDFEVHMACIRYNAGPVDFTDDSCGN